MQELLRLRDEGNLNENQAQWFRESKPTEELYDCSADPHELNNLATNPDYAGKLQELRTEMDWWIAEIGDQPNLPEAELIEQLWNGGERQPVTAEPVIKSANGKISISCATEGASIGYKLIGDDGVEPKTWAVYQEPFVYPQGAKLLVKAHRIGFKTSKVIQN